MRRVPTGLLVILVLVVFLPLVFSLLVERIQPMDIGVRQNRWGGGGVVERDFEPGFRLGIWGVHKWYRLPRQTHFMHFTHFYQLQQQSQTTMWLPDLELRTKDNNLTWLDISIPYRIKSGEGWKIIGRGLRATYTDRVKSTVEDVLRANLSELSSEDLQSTEMRLAKCAELLPLLNAQLAEFYCEAECVLVRQVTFPSEYEDELVEKQFLTQRALLDTALTLVANEELRTNSIEKQIVAAEKEKIETWNKRIQEQKSEYEVIVAGIGAQALRYEAQTRAAADAEQVRLEAEGQLAVDQADALRNELRNRILNSRGGRVFLALEAASNLELPSVMLNSNDPRVPIVLDLDAMTSLLVGSRPPRSDAAPEE